MKLESIDINGEELKFWVFDGPKSGPILHWAHANGFNGPTYYNLLHKLSKSCTVYAWDARSHGLNSSLSAAKSGEIYHRYSMDLVHLIDFIFGRHGKPVILAGHSFGATVSLRSEHILKNKISKIILADPVLFTLSHSMISSILRKLRFKYPKSIYLAKNALKRKRQWTNKKKMFEDLSKKPLFACWDELSLKNYISYGTRSINNLIELQCSPETESQIFSESEKEFLSKAIARLSTNTHIFLSSKGSPAFAKNAFHKSKKTIDFQTIAESTHMFPIESPDDFSNRMLNCLD